MPLRLVLVLLVACTPAVRTKPQDPANPKAETGRLAGPPAALRPGVVETEAPKPAPSLEHHH